MTTEKCLLQSRQKLLHNFRRAFKIYSFVVWNAFKMVCKDKVRNLDSGGPKVVRVELTTVISFKIEIKRYNILLSFK